MQEIANKISQDTIVLKKEQIENWITRLINIQEVIKGEEGKGENLFNSLQSLARKSSSVYENASNRDVGYYLLKTRRAHIRRDVKTKYTRLLQSLENNYKEAYRLIHEIRNIFYDPITYRFGFKYGESYYEATFSIEQLLKYTTLEMNSRTTAFEKLYKLRIDANQNVLKYIINQEGGVKKIEDNHLALLQKALDTETDKKVNVGQRFEAYVALKNKNNASKEEILSKALMEARRNNLAWTRGGDVGSEQVKYMDASLTTANTLIQTIDKLIEVLTNINNNDGQYLKAEIVKLFGPNTKFAKYVEENASKEIIEAFNKELKNMKNIKII